MSETIHNIPAEARPLLYTDTIGGVQTFRDDMWGLTTAELLAITSRESNQLEKIAELKRIIAGMDTLVKEADAERDQLKSWKVGVLKAAESIQCGCSLAEIGSGHHTDCWFPQLNAALDAQSQPQPLPGEQS